MDLKEYQGDEFQEQAPTFDVFAEVYDNESSDDSEEEDIQDSFDRGMPDDEQVEQSGVKLAISESLARGNYEAAGTEVEEECDRITVAGNFHLLNPNVDEVLANIVTELNLPYKPSDFQRVAVNTVGMLNNLVLVSPTGSGKMDVPLLAALVLRERLNISKGVAIVTQPLTSIMNEKIHNKICEVATLSMTGALKTSSKDEDDASLSCDLEDLLDGRYPVLMGHPESFDSDLGQHILRELQKLERLILICIDEFHQGY